MLKSKSLPLLLLAAPILCTSLGCSSAAESVVTKGPNAILKALAKYFGKESIEEASENIVAIGGRELFERAAVKVAKNGGEEIVEQVSRLTLDHGPDILRSLDNVPSNATNRIIRVFDELPEDQIEAAAKRLAAGSQGKEVAETVVQFGSNAMKTELAHPGLGPKLIRSFGNDGAELMIGLSENYAISLARHSDDLAALPMQQRKSVLELIQKDKDAFFKWLGEFVKNNPGKVVFSTAGTATLIANAENLFGRIRNKTNPDGSTEPVRVPGLADSAIDEGGDIIEKGIDTIKTPLGNTTRSVGLVLVGAIALIACIQVWKQFRLGQIAVKEAELESKQKFEERDTLESS